MWSRVVKKMKYLVASQNLEVASSFCQDINNQRNWFLIPPVCRYCCVFCFAINKQRFNGRMKRNDEETVLSLFLQEEVHQTKCFISSLLSFLTSPSTGLLCFVVRRNWYELIFISEKIFTSFDSCNQWEKLVSNIWTIIFQSKIIFVLSNTSCSAHCKITTCANCSC